MTIEKRAAFGLTFMCAHYPILILLSFSLACLLAVLFISSATDLQGGESIALGVPLVICGYVLINKYVTAQLSAIYLEQKILKTYGPRTLEMAYDWLFTDGTEPFSFNKAALLCGEVSEPTNPRTL